MLLVNLKVTVCALCRNSADNGGGGKYEHFNSF